MRELHTNELMLLQKLREDDVSALDEIYHRYWQHLYTASYNILKDKAACEDILQDLFLDIWQKRKTLDIAVSLRAYLATSVRYNVFRHIKKGTARELLYDKVDERFTPASAEAMMQQKELDILIENAVAGLPGKCQEVYRLSREEMLSHKEIASRLDISIKTVENHLTIALRKLRTVVGDYNTFLLLLLFFCKKN